MTPEATEEAATTTEAEAEAEAKAVVADVKEAEVAEAVARVQAGRCRPLRIECGTAITWGLPATAGWAMQMSGKASEVAAPAADQGGEDWGCERKWPGDGEGNMPTGWVLAGLSPIPWYEREVVMIDSEVAEYFDKKAKALGYGGLVIKEGEAMAAGDVQATMGRQARRRRGGATVGAVGEVGTEPATPYAKKMAARSH